VSWELVHGKLDACGVIGFPLPDDEREVAKQRWLETFCPNVFGKTGRWIHLGIRWHAYSYGFEHATTGELARATYLEQQARDFLLYVESHDLLFDCFGTPSPLLWQDDLYVFPRDLAWTMVFTHEEDAGLGPYFARPAS
jgi:hypothetical protein